MLILQTRPQIWSPDSRVVQTRRLWLPRTSLARAHVAVPYHLHDEQHSSLVPLLASDPAPLIDPDAGLELENFLSATASEGDHDVGMCCEGCKNFTCGPNVTTQVQDAVKMTSKAFAGWKDDKKEKACSSLISFDTGWMAWDIVELHNQAWILEYRPACASQGAEPHCGSSVQVGNQCYYAGSANYVIFGTMFKLCYDFHNARGTKILTGGPVLYFYIAVKDFYTESEMLDWIEFWKGDKAWMHLSGRAGNVETSKRWASAGYRGWPASGSPPVGDRNNCKPSCAEPYVGVGFTVRWHPTIIGRGWEIPSERR